MARALGLETLDQSLHDFFSHTDLDAMRLSASEISDLIATCPPAAIESRAREQDDVGNNVLEITAWIDRHKAASIMPRKLLLVKQADPRLEVRTIIDEFSLLLWARRKRFTVRFGLLTFAVFSVALGFYGWFWNSLSSIGAGVLAVGAIIYLPPIVFWLLLVRPYGRVLRSFPTVSEELLGTRENRLFRSLSP